MPSLVSPNFEIFHNDQGLLAWLKNSIYSRDIGVLKEQRTEFQHHQDMQYQHQHPQQVSASLPIVTKPLVENVISMQPNIVHAPPPIVYKPK